MRTFSTSIHRSNLKRCATGKNCLELPNSFGRNADYDTIKAFVSRRHDHGRDAYGRVEDIKDIGRTYVIWHTGNNPKLFRDPTGNRRFIPMPISGEINEKLLRQVRDQIWAEAVELERIGRLAYYEKMRQEGIPVEEGDEKFPDIMLNPKFYNDAALLQSDARVENEYQEMVADVTFQQFVHFEEKTAIKDSKRLLFRPQSMYCRKISGCIWVSALANGIEPHKRYLKQCKI